MKRGIRFVPLTLLLLLFSGACATRTTYIHREPPAKKIEIRSVKPSVDYVWIEGHWQWSRAKDKYIWKNGYWKKIKHKKVWVSGHWKQTPKGWTWIQGYWK